jgi:hypothetical protein
MLSEMASLDLTVQFNKNFKEQNASLPFVQQMALPIQKKWAEMRTELHYNQRNIQILIVDDSVSQIDSIRAILSRTNV